MELDPIAIRERLRAARLMLVFTPAACRDRDPLDVLATLAPHVDVVQVRPKPAGVDGAVTRAREALELARATLSVLRRTGATPLVVVNDRPDVALALSGEGVAGVHLGADDVPVAAARELLGRAPLIGLSTHSLEDVARAEDAPVDYLGFGPIHPTSTKGVGRGLGSAIAWVAAASAAVPVFPIGGVDATNAAELEQVGRAAVGAGLLNAADAAAEARNLRAALVPPRSQGTSSIASPKL